MFLVDDPDYAASSIPGCGYIRQTGRGVARGYVRKSLDLLLS